MRQRDWNRDPVQCVMMDPGLVSLIASFLRYDYMKDCRGVNKLWRFVVTKLVRSKTRVCVNEENLNFMIYGSTVLGLSLHIRWSPFIRTGMSTFLQKYCRYIDSLSWFLDRSGDQADNSTSTITLNPLLVFPSVKTLYLFVTKTAGCSTNFVMSFICDIIKKCPLLQSLRLEILDDKINATDIIIFVKSLKLAKLKSLHFGKEVHLSFEAFEIIKLLDPPIENFTWEAKIHDIKYYEQAINGQWLTLLKTLSLKSSPKLYFPSRPAILMERLSVECMDFTLSVQLKNHFPNLKKLSFTLKPGYNWENWIPKNMISHNKITSLSWLDKNLGQNDRECLIRLFSKLPNLRSLQCPSDDDFLQVICMHLPKLKKLKLNGACSDCGVTGLSRTNMRDALKMLEDKISFYHVKQALINRVRDKPCIYDLKDLEELTFMHTKITDLVVTLVIPQMPQLRKLYITGISMRAILQLLKHPCLKEIGVPQPLEGKISYEEIALLQSTTPHMKIISGWDATAFQSI